MADADHRMDVATGIEVRLELHPDRITGSHQIVENFVGHLFMGDGAVPVAVHIELDRLELHHPWAWLIDQPEDRKVGITRERTETGEFGQFDRDLVGPPLTGVVETDQLGISDGPLSVERSPGGLGNSVTQGSLPVVVNPRRWC